MEKRQLPFLTVVALAHLIKTHEVSPVEVVEAHLERIERLNPQLHAFLTVCPEDARRAARTAEHEIAHGAYRGALHGIPCAVKDQLSTRGIRTTAGSPLFADVVPDEDATVIAKLHQAGAILLGKLNMTEFGTTGFSHQFSTPRNPWDLARYTGSSSSGSGAATAAGLCATSLGACPRKKSLKNNALKLRRDDFKISHFPETRVLTGGQNFCTFLKNC